MILLILIIYLYGLVLTSPKQIKFSTNVQVSKAIDISKSPGFNNWFRRPSAVLEILKLNPGIQSVEQIQSGSEDSGDLVKYKSYLSPLRFPGLTVQSVVEFNARINNDGSFALYCNDNSTKQEFIGSKILASIVSRLTPTITSQSCMRYDEIESKLYNNSTLEIAFPVPSWFPLNADIVAKEGSKAIQTSLSQDLEKLLDKVFAKFDET